MNFFAPDKITFQVQGSADEPYTVTFYKKSANLSAICTCQAGQNGIYCKHRFNIMRGDTTGIVSNNLESVKTVRQWVAGTDVELAMNEVLSAEKTLEDAKKTLSRAKKNLSKSMYD